MIYVLVAILLIACILVYFEDYMADVKWNIYIGMGVLLVLIAALRPLGMDNDSENYEIYFLNYDTPIFENFVEFSYRFLSKWLYFLFKDVHSIFFLYAAIGITLKFIAIRRLTPLIFLSLAVYLGNYYILHEFTQIRAGIASGLLLLSIKPLSEGKRLHAMVYMLVALFFHYSSIIMLPMLLLSNKEMSFKWRVIWMMIVPVGYVAYFMHVGITSLPIPYIQEKMDMYEELRDKNIVGEDINVFNLVFLTKIIIYMYLFYMYDTIKVYNKYLPIMLKITGFSIFSFIALSSIPVIAFRVSELYGIIDIILFTNIFYTVRPAWLARTIVIVIGISMFFINVFYSKILQIM